MRVPMNWLKEYVDVTVSTQDYANRMVMAGTGVEGIDEQGEAFTGVVVGEVLACEDLEGSDHLHICRVDAGQGEPLQIVCGAPNVKAGLQVPVALEGARLPGGHTIKRGKLRGAESQGMLCSGAELGIPDGLYPNCGEAGLLIFTEKQQNGADIRPIVGLDDAVIDFEILANRPDCLSIWGIARESAAVLDTHCVMPEIGVEETAKGDITGYARIEIRDAAACPRYCGRMVDNVKIARSPLWMRKHLHAAGIRPINNIVDITNYVMLETGHPMHAFDLSKVKDQTIIVRPAKPGESLTTLDGKTHQLNESMLVIADAHNATGLAGIMGGEESEIAEGTTRVLFECAAFDRTSIRLTSRALGIRTESSGRFERGVNPMTARQAIERACMLVNMLECGDVAPGLFDFYPNPVPEREVMASVSRINERISTRLSGEQMEDILLRLGLDVTLVGDELTCVIPEWRRDIEGEADLSEEVLRLYGYDHIPSTLPVSASVAGFRSDLQLLQDRIKQSLVGMGFYEAMNFSFVSRKWAESLDLPKDDWRLDPVVVKNPLGEDTSVMRTSLAPSMLSTLSTNINRSNPEGRLFELSCVFKKGAAHELPEEPDVLCIGMYGEFTDFFSLKDAVWCLLQRLGIVPEIEKGGDPYLHPGRKAVLTVNGVPIGQLGEAHPEVALRFGIEGKRVQIAELSLSELAQCQRPVGAVVALPRFPAVSRDIALVMNEGTGVGPVMGCIQKAAGELLEDVRLFDIYRGAQLGQDKKSVAFALSFRASDRTLTEDEINTAMKRVLDACEAQFGAHLRT